MNKNISSFNGTISENYDFKYMSLFYKMNDINTTQMKYKDDGQKYFKDPIDNNWKEFFDKEQSLEYVLNRNWEDAVGIGAVLGWDGLRAIDVDGIGEIFWDDDAPFSESLDVSRFHENSVFPYLLSDFLSLLGLPKDYPWVTISGSYRGFHILFRCDNVDLQADSLSFAASNNCLDRGFPFFDHLELRWSDHLVLPPSLHKSGKRYLFRYNTPPTTKISEISITDIDRLLSKYCGIRTFKKYKLKDGTRFEVTEIQKCTSREGSYYSSPSEYRGDTIDWLQKTNSDEARNSLALRYLFGQGEEKNVKEALKILKNTNSQSCFFNLASLYASGGIKWNNDRFLHSMSNLDLELFGNHIALIEENNKKNQETNPYYLFFDTETTGLLKEHGFVGYPQKYPRLVQISWILTSRTGNIISKGDCIVRPDGFEIPLSASDIHGISTEIAYAKGSKISYVMEQFFIDVKKASVLVGHNIDYDISVVDTELRRLGKTETLKKMRNICIMKESTTFCKIPDYYGKEYKYPKLQELYSRLFGCTFNNAHNAMADVKATMECFFELKRLGVI